MMNLNAFVLIFGLAISAAFAEITGNVHYPETPLSASMRRKPKVVGGVEVEPNSKPYQVGMFLRPGFCGGSLITNRYVLTAAHCLFKKTNVTVVLGAHKVQEKEPTQLKMTAKKLILHEKYNPQKLSNDIALIELPEKVTFNEYIKPVRLASADDGLFVNRKANVSGWGLTFTNAPQISPVLRTAGSKILSNKDCAKDFRFKVLDTVICLDGKQLRSACNGDSGGPLVVETEEGDLQVGVVSYGSSFGCDKGYPSAFTRITRYVDWIKKNSDYEENFF